VNTRRAARRRRRWLATIGWRERVALPEFEVDRIRAKIDTGAQTSSLHASRPEITHEDDGEWISFELFPRRRSRTDAVRAKAKVLEHRWIRSSNGQREYRPVISTKLGLGGDVWEAEFTLTNRNNMSYRMILGRSALRGRFIVDSGLSYLLSGGE
jgi:hypothetical protein